MTNPKIKDNDIDEITPARANTDALAAYNARVRAEALREAVAINLDVEVRTASWRHAALDTEAAYRAAILALIPDTGEK